MADEPDSSLSGLTRRFAELARKCGGELDVNDAARALDVKKRRLYDVTSVLMGIGAIEKKSRSVIAFKGPMGFGGGASVGASSAASGGGLMSVAQRRQLAAMTAEARLLDASIMALRGEMDSLRADPQYSQFAYLTRLDVRTLPAFEDATVLALQAPPGTRVSMPGEGVHTHTHARARTTA